MRRQVLTLVAAATLIASSGAGLTQARNALTPAQKAALDTAVQAMGADGLEHAVCLDASDRVIGVQTGSIGSIDLDCDPARLTTLIHTHPQGAAPSPTDIGQLLGGRYPALDRSIIQGADGVVTTMDGLRALPRRSPGEVALNQSRYHLLEEVFALARPDAPPTRTWALGQLCAGLELTCHAGAAAGALTPLAAEPLSGSASDPIPLFSARLRAALHSWLGGGDRSDPSWAEVGDLARSGALASAYLEVVFLNDNGAFRNSAGPFAAMTNLYRQTSAGTGETFEIFSAGRQAGQLDVCIRTGADVRVRPEGQVASTRLVRLEGGRFEVLCFSREDPALRKTFRQVIDAGRVRFYRDAATSSPVFETAVDRGCAFDPARLQRSCANANGADFVIIEPDPQ